MTLIDITVIKTMIQKEYAMQEIFDMIDELQKRIDDYEEEIRDDIRENNNNLDTP